MDMDKELNCSEGARMLIERMQSHPDDFKPGGRFYWVAEKLRGVSPKGQNELSERDWHALQDAFDKAVLEPWLTETVVDEIFNGDKRREEEQKAYTQTSSAYSQRLGQSMMNTKNQIAANMLSGFHDPRLMWPGGVPPQNPAQGQVLWTEETGLQEKTGPSIFDEIRRVIKRKPK